MALLKKAWNNFKVEPEIWFFYLFLATSMLSIRKVVADIFIGGEFNEYTGIYFYMSDIFLLLTIVAWIVIILYNKISNLSIKNFSVQRLPREAKLFHVEQFSFLRGGTLSVLLIPLILVAWSFISVKWSNDASISLYRSFKLFEFYLLFLFLALNSKCSTLSILRNAFRILIAIGLINAIIGIFQVILQHSLGLFWLKESLISPDLPGVAKIVLGDAKYIRAYGLFPHPNILGGFLLMSILFTLVYHRLFHSSTNVPRGTLYGAGVKQSAGSTEMKSILNPSLYFKLILAVQIVAGILTFSKSAFLGLILALAYMFWHDKAKMFPVEQFKFLKVGLIKKFLLLAIIGVLALFLIHPDFSSIFTKSLVERLVYINISLNMIYGNFLDGIGSGQFVLEMQKYSSQLLLPWQFQPVHNVFLLIWSELGLIGLGLFVYFIGKLFHPSRNVPPQYECSTPVRMFHVEHPTGQAWNILRGRRGTSGSNYELLTVFKALLIGLFVIALFDHYLWDIQQGQIMLWLALGFLTRTDL